MTITKAIIKFSNSVKYSLLTQAILCLTWALKEALFPLFIKNIVNNLTGPSTHYQLSKLYTQIGILIGIWILMEIALRVQGAIASRIFPRLRGVIREYAYSQLQKYPENYQEKSLSGTIASKVIGLPNSIESIIEILVLHIPSIGSAFLIGLVLLFNVNATFALLSLIWASLHILTHVVFSKYCIEKTTEHADAEFILNGKIADTIANSLTTRLYSNKDHEVKKFNTTQDDEIKKAKTSRKAIEAPKYIQSLLAICFMGSTMFLLVHKWKLGTVTLGDFALVPMLSFSIVGMVTWFGFHINTFLKEAGLIQAALDILDYKPSNEEKSEELCVNQGNIEIHQLSFKYPLKQNLFSDLNLNINQGEKIGIIGISGAGKSTLTKLITGILTPNDGIIKINNQNVSHINIEKLSTLITLVPQTPELYSGSILENIVYGVSSYNIENVVQVIKLVEAEDFINTLPDGYNTIIGERGNNISLGQAQRIALARAIIRNKPILILDEATSALDSKTEAKLFDNLQGYLQKKTMLLISHHTRTLKYVDRVLVVQAGQLIEYSNHDVENSLSSANKSKVETT